MMCYKVYDSSSPHPSSNHVPYYYENCGGKFSSSSSRRSSLMLVWLAIFRRKDYWSRQ